MAPEAKGDLKAVAARLLPCLDLTSLNEDDTPAATESLCRRAVTPFGAVAAVCISPRFVARARAMLRDADVRIATVANFPQGHDEARAVAAEIEAALRDGAEEIDVVINYVAYLAGARDAAMEPVTIARRCCGDGARVKVILETGQLARPDIILAAARDAIAAGADFLKTSTGKTTPGATAEAAEMLFTCIRDHRRATGRKIGLKAAGGIRTVVQARAYADLADRFMGPDYVCPATFRIGASGLLDDILAVLGDGERRQARASY
jgi:deoxyribose-phosphate aldolase